MVTNEVKEQIFKSMDSKIGKDLITSVSEIRQQYKLTHQEFYPIFIEWFKQPIKKIC